MSNASTETASLQIEQFNEPQKRRLVSSASYIDKLLTDIDQILSASMSGGLPKYKNPLTPVQVRVVRDYIKRLRQQIVHVLADLDIDIPEARFDSAFSIRVTLQFIEIALEEIAPHRLGGYGPVPESLVKPLAGGLQEMRGIVRQMASYLSQRVESDLSNRVQKLANTTQEADLIKKIAELLERYSLVEFRAPLAQLLEKIESPTYEIAFFGRVSTGKSSLLNEIIGIDLLPIGVTPITAVPTRVKNGPAAQLLIATVEGTHGKYPVSRLPEFVTEAQNPGNEKRITRLLVEIPLPILPDEVILVDTPGLGSLALEGAAETLAYLPRCDLGVVLVDASSNLQADDVATVDALRAASIPALVVLSKADLVPGTDRQSLLEYTRSQLARQIGIPIEVALLSSRPEFKPMLQDWVGQQITPRVANARRLADESNRRKVHALGLQIVDALAMLSKTSGVSSDRVTGDFKKAESQLRDAASLIESTRDECFEATGSIRNGGHTALIHLTESALDVWQQTDSFVIDQTWITKAVNQVAEVEAGHLANIFQKTAKELTNALDFAASLLSATEREDRLNLQDFVKNMPPADFNTAPLQIDRPRLIGVSASLARHSLRKELEKRVGPAVEEFFSSYGRTIEVWMRGTLDNLAREFETQADVYRAQLQRLTHGAASQAAVSSEGVLEDIAFLRRELDLGVVESAASVT